MNKERSLKDLMRQHVWLHAGLTQDDHLSVYTGFNSTDHGEAWWISVRKITKSCSDAGNKDIILCWLPLNALDILTISEVILSSPENPTSGQDKLLHYSL